MNAREALATAKAICDVCHMGALTYDEAKAKCAPLIAIFNDKGKTIAAKYGRRYSPITFTGLMR